MHATWHRIQWFRADFLFGATQCAGVQKQKYNITGIMNQEYRQQEREEDGFTPTRGEGSRELNDTGSAMEQIVEHDVDEEFEKDHPSPDHIRTLLDQRDEMKRFGLHHKE
mmetsp:Transcript_3355/g.6770  ORF Transcript_3355/g.6770 Transcript_3355/m.6770 type:complete len:110 (+) Transcript_3355:463-792(+)